MRKNIFLDFLSPDNWKTYATIPKEQSLLSKYKNNIISGLKKSITASVMLSAQYCLLPPAFIVQSPITFQAVSESSLYLDEKRIFLPLRENSIDQYISKKIDEYSSVKKSHSGFYDDSHWGFLARYQSLLIHRKAAMGMTIANQWLIVPDTSPTWKPIVEYSPWVAERLRRVPSLIKQQGKSVTLEAIEAETINVDISLRRSINQAIQHEYIRAYLQEYNATILSNAPPKPINENYLIPIESCYYDYSLFSSVLSLMGLQNILLESRPEIILDFISTIEYDELINAYWEICEKYQDINEIKRVYKELIIASHFKNNIISYLTTSLIKNYKLPNSVKERISKIAYAWEEKKNKKEREKGEDYILSTTKQKVFIVHGHDTDKRNQVELFLRRIGLEPIILCNEPSKGKTIIDKFEAYSDVSFAIVLYTACDEGREKGKSDLKDRARQNVVFEHGYFCAKLGRPNVVALHEAGVELPGDLSGIVYISFDSDWKEELKKEMNAAGIKADWLKS